MSSIFTTKPPTRSPSRCPPRLFAVFNSRCPALCLCRFRTSTALPVVSVCPSLDQTCSRVCPMSDSLVDPFFRLQVSTLILSRDLTRKREGVTAPGCSLPGQRLFCPPLPAHAPARRPHCLIPFYIRHHFSAISVRNTASLSEGGGGGRRSAAPRSMLCGGGRRAGA